MRRKILIILISLLIILGGTGCIQKSSKNINSLNNSINEYFTWNPQYIGNPYVYNYVNENENVIVVGLLNNTKEEQKWFKKAVLNSKYVKFEKAKNVNFDVSSTLDHIINNGPQTSSSPFDYVNASKEEYEKLLANPKETFEYAIKDLIESNASKGLRSYIEALLCIEINEGFNYDFESANDFLDNYKKYLENNNDNLTEYDKYAKSLLNL